MFDHTTLTLFIIAALALLLMPGPAVLYIVARSIDQGRMAGVISALGAGVGTIVHILAAALGVSALLVSSALAFSIVKYVGAAYLIYLGITTLLKRTEPTRIVVTDNNKPLKQVFSQSILVNVLNPKTALFFYAFLPQFVDASRGSVTGQILMLGLLFVGMGIVSDSAYAMLAGTVGGWMRGNPTFLRKQRYFAGGTYITLGIATAFAAHTPSK